jgi:integrase
MASILKRNDRWFVRVRKHGQPSQSKTFTVKQDAQRWTVMIERQIDQGLVGCVDKSVTLGDLLKRYLKEVIPHKNSRDKETWRVKALLKRSVSGVGLNNLTSTIISNYKTLRLVDGARTTRYDLALIRHCLEFARLEWGYYLPINPVDLVSKPRLNKPRDRRVGKDDINALMHALKQTKVTYLKPLILFAIETGLRQGELIKLKWNDVDLDSRLLKVKDTKNGEDRVVPLSNKSLSILQSLPRLGATVFNASHSSLQNAWKRLIKRSGLNDLHFHDLRHEAISRFIEQGLTIPEAASISGHRTQSMLLRYAHPDLSYIKKKVTSF